MRIVMLSLLLLSTTAFGQAVRPAPAPAPTGVVQLPPTYPGQTYTPAGAGASHGSLAAPETPAVARSPNRRVLPASGELGVWAADEVKGAKPRADDLPAKIAGVVLPSPEKTSTRGSRVCAGEMTNALGAARKQDVVAALSEGDRRCLAAQLFRYCAQDNYNREWDRMDHDPANATPESDMWAKTLRTAEAFEKKECTETLAGRLERLVDLITMKWEGAHL